MLSSLRMFWAEHIAPVFRVLISKPNTNDAHSVLFEVLDRTEFAYFTDDGVELRLRLAGAYSDPDKLVIYLEAGDAVDGKQPEN